MATMKNRLNGDAIKTITNHTSTGTFVESTPLIMDVIRPTNGESSPVTLGDEEDTRRAIAAAKRAFATLAKRRRRSERSLCVGCMSRFRTGVDDLTAAMIEEYAASLKFSSRS